MKVDYESESGLKSVSRLKKCKWIKQVKVVLKSESGLGKWKWVKSVVD